MSSQYTNRDGSKSKDTIVAEAINEKLYPALNEGIKLFMAGHDGKTSVERLVRDFGHTEEDANLWLSRARYSESMHLNRENTIESLRILKLVGLVSAEFDDSLIYRHLRKE